MKSVIEYLNDLKDKTGSDYMSAKQLGITKESVSGIRRRGKMSDDTAVKMADLLGIERDEVLIAAAIARSSGEVKSAWEKIGKISGISASLAIVATVSFSVVSMGYEDFLITGQSADNIHYAKFNIFLLFAVFLVFFTKLKFITYRK